MIILGAMCEYSCSISHLPLDERCLKSVVEKLNQDTKKFLHKSKVAHLLQHLLLVIEGYREGYLVDGCSVTKDDISDLTRSLCSSLYAVNIQLFSPLITLAMGPNQDDLLIFRSDQLQRKIIELSTVGWINRPLIVDVNGSIPHICEEEEIQFIRLSLLDTVKDIFRSPVDFYSITGDNSFHRKVGLPFIAGWLLGYPCVYRSTAYHMKEDMNDGQHLGNALSMTMLRKYSINASINSTVHSIIHRNSSSSSSSTDKRNKINRLTNNSGKNPIPSSHDSSCTDIDIFEFTVPLDLISEGSLASLNLIEWLDKKGIELEVRRSSTSSDITLLRLVDCCHIKSEDIILPSLAL